MKSLEWIAADERARCTHDSAHGLWWLHGQWVDWTVALSHKMRWEQMAAHRCNGCGAWMPMLASNDTSSAVQNEIALAACIGDMCRLWEPGRDREEQIERYVEGFASQVVKS